MRCCHSAVLCDFFGATTFKELAVDRSRMATPREFVGSISGFEVAVEAWQRAA
jgi:hypothetical protein